MTADASPPIHDGYQPPSVTGRLVGSVLVGVGLLIVLVALPVEVLGRVEAFGVSVPYSTGTIVLAGVVLAALGAARHALRPTSAYGPVSIVASTVLIVYLLDLAAESTTSFSLGASLDLKLSYGSVLDLLAIVPALRLAAAVVVTVEDLARPGERVRYEFPGPGSFGFS